MTRHDFEIVAMWEAKTDRRTEFVYLFRRPDEQTKIDAWAAFMADQEWDEIKLIHARPGQPRGRDRGPPYPTDRLPAAL
jgi:hypothetical protein